MKNQININPSQAGSGAQHTNDEMKYDSIGMFKKRHSIKKAAAAFIAGCIISTAISVYAVAVSVTENIYLVTVNGKEVNISGYNIDGSTYFKLRDVADAVGGLFTVGFENNIITITTNTPEPAASRPAGNFGSQSLDDIKAMLDLEVSQGRMTREQADEILTQMQNGTMQPGTLPQGGTMQPGTLPGGTMQPGNPPGTQR